jgi:hypothetical protein
MEVPLAFGGGHQSLRAVVGLRLAIPVTPDSAIASTDGIR